MALALPLLLLSALALGAAGKTGSEKDSFPCKDSHAECEDWAAKGNQCIANSWYMRQACRKSCNVYNCAKRVSGTWEGFATPYGTRSYASSHPGAQSAAGEHFRWAAVGSPRMLPGVPHSQSGKFLRSL